MNKEKYMIISFTGENDPERFTQPQNLTHNSYCKVTVLEILTSERRTKGAFSNINEKILAKLNVHFHFPLLAENIFTMLKLHSFNFV